MTCYIKHTINHNQYQTVSREFHEMLTFLQGKVKVYQSINQNKTYTTPYVAKKKRLLVGALEGFYAAKAD